MSLPSAESLIIVNCVLIEEIIQGIWALCVKRAVCERESVVQVFA
jgi:hypothetical protein